MQAAVIGFLTILELPKDERKHDGAVDKSSKQQVCVMDEKPFLCLKENLHISENSIAIVYLCNQVKIISTYVATWLQVTFLIATNVTIPVLIIHSYMHIWYVFTAYTVATYLAKYICIYRYNINMLMKTNN